MTRIAMPLKLVFSGHALQRMFQRSIDPQEVRSVLEQGETIEKYADDKPFPSRLVLSRVRLHGVGIARRRTLRALARFLARARPPRAPARSVFAFHCPHKGALPKP
jgi:hypothetical protein